MAVPKSVDHDPSAPGTERQRLADALDRGLDALDAGRVVSRDRVRTRIERFFTERRRAGGPRNGT